LFSDKFAFLILTKNEENSISELLNNLKKEIAALKISDYKILLVDDSSDRTPQVAEALGAEVITGRRKGLGDAYRLGLESCLQHAPDYIVSLDGDGQVQLSELSLFLNPLTTGFDLVVGSRFKDTESINYSYPFMNRVGSILLSGYLSFMTRQKLTDSHGGFRAMRAEVAKKTKFFGDHTYVQETLVEAAEAGYKIKEISSDWNIRKHGGSRVVRSKTLYMWRVGPHLLRRLLKRLFTGKSR
jgi:glycosyltransferase involved in cell wall biosynthesis